MLVFVCLRLLGGGRERERKKRRKKERKEERGRWAWCAPGEPRSLVASLIEVGTLERCARPYAGIGKEHILGLLCHMHANHSL